VGHLLAGASAYAAGSGSGAHAKTLLALVLVGSLAPDLDFVPGILIGDLRAFHHGISHSLMSAAAFGVLVYLVAIWSMPDSAARAAVLAATAYAVHVVLDFASVTEGRGVPLLWPVSREELGMDLGLFGHFRYGDIHEGAWMVVRKENVLPILRETVVLGSLLVGLSWRRRVVDLVLGRSRRGRIHEG
jgi:hypothetical protein